MPERTWLTTKEAAIYASVHPNTIRKWINSGDLEHKNIGQPGTKVWRIRPEAIDAFFERQTEINEALSA